MLLPLSLLASLATAAEVPSYAELLDARRDLTTQAFLASLPKAPDAPLGFDVRKAGHYKEVVSQLKLTQPEVAALESTGFTIVDPGQRLSMGSAYYTIYAQDLPVLITTDSILHAMHRSFDDLLMELEAWALLPAMDAILKRTHAAVVAEGGEQPSEAHRDLDLHLTVARALLAGDALKDQSSVRTHYSQDDLLEDILKRVRDMELETPETEQTLLYGRERMIDWTQFRPRGHYTKSRDLQRYFHAMMWLGRADTGFELEHDREVRAAVLLSTTLQSAGTLEGLGEIDLLLEWMVGPSDNLAPDGMLAALAEAEVSLDQLDNPKALKRLRAHMKGTQRIRSQVVESNPDDPIRVPPPDLFQIFGQRFVPDSFVLSEVVFDSILYQGKKVERLMPSSLDVAAALGNPEAARILGETDLRTHPYAANLDATRAWLDAQPDDFWTDTAASTWLATLRHLHTDLSDEPNAPAVMKGAAWQRKQLQTQLASWSEYRHDTVLYAKQSYTAFPSCEYPTGYVEPYPAVYAGTAAFARSLADALDHIHLDRIVTDPNAGAEHIREMQRRQVDFLNGFAERADWLVVLAEKELAGKPLGPADTRLLKATIDIRGGGSGPPRYDGWYPQMFYGGGYRSSEWSPEVVDVHTDPASGQVLEVGTGDVEFLVVAIDNEGDTRVYVGPSYSYYETRWPVQERLTDEAWAKLFFEDKEPDRPAWMAPLLHGETERRY
jgi:hypothetical protein